MLYSRFSSTPVTPDKPVLVLLHGLLGNSEDWEGMLRFMPEQSWLAIDLPGHGQSSNIDCTDFFDCCKKITHTIFAQLGQSVPIIWVGYSLGGRLAMLGACLRLFNGINLQGIVIEGGNVGLQSEQERKARWCNDTQWANRFRIEPIEQVLSDWYRQPVFSSLNDEQRQTLITKRSANLGEKVANMLLSTSLAHQPYLLPSLQDLSLPMQYVCGAKDKKFCQLAEQCGLVYSQISSAGHNVHQEQPEAFAQTIQIFIDSLPQEVRDNNIGNNHG